MRFVICLTRLPWDQNTIQNLNAKHFGLFRKMENFNQGSSMRSIIPTRQIAPKRNALDRLMDEAEVWHIIR